MFKQLIDPCFSSINSGKSPLANHSRSHCWTQWT